MKKNFPYIHGYSKEEQDRLYRQANFAETTIYRDVDFTECHNILEVGCGVGAQTEILLRRFPHLKVTGIDINEKQLETAHNKLKASPWLQGRYEILKMDANKLEFKAKSFDGAFICWFLEHLSDPQRALSEVRRVLKPGSPLYLTEVLNSTFFLDPYSPNVWKFWMSFNDYQLEQKGDPFVGAKLGNFLLTLGFNEISTQVINWHFDNRNPEKRREFILHFKELMLSASESLISGGYVTEDLVKKAELELENVSRDPNAVFFDAIVQARAKV